MIAVTIFCDNCNVGYTDCDDTGAAIRALAKKHGWHVGRGEAGAQGPGSRDICPPCWEKGAR